MNNWSQKRKTRSWTAIAILVLSLPVIEVNGQNVPGLALQKMQPMRGYDPTGYTHALLKNLVGDGWPELWMVCNPHPAEEREYGIILRSQVLAPRADIPLADNQRRRWTLERVRAKTAFWEPYVVTAPGVFPARMDAKLAPQIQVARDQMEVGERLAQKLTAAWSAAIRLAKYPKDPPSGIDGLTYLFYSNSMFSEGTLGDKPRAEDGDLAALGERLISVFDVSLEHRASALKACETDAESLESRAHEIFLLRESK
jgi:hypothetical protein